MCLARLRALGWLCPAYALLLATYCVAGFAPDWLRFLANYAQHGHSADLFRLWSYAELIRGGNVDLSPLMEWNGELGSAGAIQPVARPGQPLLPYRDFALEYPPVCVLLLWLPRLWVRTLQGYHSAFAAEMAGLNLAALLLACSWVWGRPQAQERLRTLCLLSLLAAAGLGPLMVSRLDPVLALTLMGALVAARRERPFLCGSLIGLASGAKLLPLLLLPPFGLHWWYQGARSAAFRCLLACALTLLVVFGPVAWMGGPNLRLLLSFHGQRPFEIESTYASLMLAHKLMGGPEVVAQAFGSRCVRAPYESYLMSLATLAPFLLSGLVMLLYARQLQRAGQADPDTRCAWLLRAQLGLMVGLIVSVKVLSPQYLIPLIPLVFLLDDRPVAWRATDRVMLACCLLTQLIFPIFWERFKAPEAPVVLLLLLRNGLLVLLWWQIVRPWMGRFRQ